MVEDWEKIKVSLRSNETEAFITVPFLTEDALDMPLTLQDARKALTAAGVNTGIKEDVLKEIFENALFDQEILVAEARQPENGLDAKIEFFFEHKKEFIPKEDESGRIDFKDISFLHNVNKGDQLCRRLPPTPGKPGATVTGKPINPKPGKDRVMPGGTNTEISEGNPDILIAATSGSVSFNRRNNKVEVHPNMEIKGDVDFTTGNLDFVGSLRVVGDIKAGFKVKVTGDLEVGGCVEDAEVEAKGNILVKKGFVGRGNGIIRSAGDVTVKYVQGQQIECEGDLNLGGELMHSTTKVSGSVNVTSRKGAIIGGVVRALGSIEATQIGNESYTHTEVGVGVNFKLLDRLEEIDRNLEQIANNQEKLKKGLYHLSRLKIQLKGKLPPEQAALHERMQETVRFFPAQKAELEEEKKRLESEIDQHRNACVKVTKSLFPGVKISIGKSQRLFNEKHDGKTFREIKGEIIPTV